MKRATRLRMRKILLAVSLLVAGAGTGLWYAIKSAGGDVPVWLLGMISYGWIFVAFLGLNQVGRVFSRRKPPR